MHTTKRGLIRWHEHFHLTKRLLSCDDTVTAQRNITCCNETWHGTTKVFAVGFASYPSAGYKLRLTRVPAAAYKLRLNPSYGWLKFQRLDTSCSWLSPTADLSSSDWVRVTADSIPRLTRVTAARYDLQLIHPAADYELWLILFCGWLEFRRLDSKCG